MPLSPTEPAQAPDRQIGHAKPVPDASTASESPKLLTPDVSAGKALCEHWISSGWVT